MIAFPSVVTIPVCAQIDTTNLDLLKSFMAAQPNLLKYQFTPLQNIQRWTGRGDDSLFDSILVYQNLADQVDYGGLAWDMTTETSTADVYSSTLEREILAKL